MGKRFWYILMPLLHFDGSDGGSFYGPIEAILNEPNNQERDKLTSAWRDNMREQLKVVMITSTLVSSIISGSFSWPIFDTELHGSYGIMLQFVKLYWYAALALSISSVAWSWQQLAALYRYSSYANNHNIICKLLSKDAYIADNRSGTVESDNRLQLKAIQAYLWQVPTIMLSWGLFIYFIGLFVLEIIEILLYIEQAGGLGWEFGVYLVLGGSFTIVAVSNYTFVAIGINYSLRVAKDSLKH